MCSTNPSQLTLVDLCKNSKKDDPLDKHNDCDALVDTSLDQFGKLLSTVVIAGGQGPSTTLNRIPVFSTEKNKNLCEFPTLQEEILHEFIVGLVHDVSPDFFDIYISTGAVFKVQMEADLFRGGNGITGWNGTFFKLKRKGSYHWMWRQRTRLPGEGPM